MFESASHFCTTPACCRLQRTVQTAPVVPRVLTVRGSSRTRSSAATPPPRRNTPVPAQVDVEPRRSLRQRGVASDGVSVVEELRGGAVTTNIYLPAEPAAPKERHPKGAHLGPASGTSTGARVTAVDAA